MTKVKIAGYSTSEGYRTFEILDREEIEKIIEELDMSEVWKQTYEKGSKYMHSGTAYTCLKARTGEVKTYWLGSNTFDHPWDCFDEIILCNMSTGSNWWDFDNAEDLLNLTDPAEMKKWEEFEGSAEEFVVAEYGEEELEERIKNCIDWYADEFTFDWQNITEQLDNLYSKVEEE